MHNLDFEAVERHLRLINSDPALAHSFKARHPTLVALLSDMFGGESTQQGSPSAGCPSAEDVTAVQCTIFDNWIHTRRGNRWGASVKVYTTAPVKNWRKPAWTATAALWPIAEALKKARSLQSSKLKNPISGGTVELVQEAVDTNGIDAVGILCRKHPAEGTFFHERHILGIAIEDGLVTRGFMYTPRWAQRLPPFVTTDASGSALTGRAVAMSRHSDLESFANWTTNN